MMMKTPWRAFVDGVIDNDEKVTTLKNGYQIKDYRHDGVVVTAPPSGASGLGSSSGRRHLCCVLGLDTFFLQCLSPPMQTLPLVI